MIKNLGKFKQWAGEKLGDVKYTLQTDEFIRLEQETESRRKGYDDLVNAVKNIEEHLSKSKSSSHENKSNNVPFEILGKSLSDYGKVYPENSALGIALIELGNMETELGKLQVDLSKEVSNGYLSTLSTGQEEYKHYDYLKRKLESRRLDYDAKLNRLSKAKKEKPELEQEMQASKIKYEETERDLFDQMARIQLFEREHRDGLVALIDAQYSYHIQAMKSLEAMKSSFGKKGTFSDPYISLSQSNLFDSSNRVTAHSYKSEGESTLFSQSQSYDTRNSVDSSFYDDGQAPPEDDDTYRKALYDFKARNDDEVGFKAGDIIQVIDEIDKGWWVGEANSKRGIFPVNYTEPYQQDGKEEEKRKNKRKSETVPVLPVTPPPQSITDVSSGILETAIIDQKERSLINGNSKKSVATTNNNNNQTQAVSNHPKIACSECDCQTFEDNPFKHGFCKQCLHKHLIPS